MKISWLINDGILKFHGLLGCPGKEVSKSMVIGSMGYNSPQ